MLEDESVTLPMTGVSGTLDVASVDNTTCGWFQVHLIHWLLRHTPFCR